MPENSFDSENSTPSNDILTELISGGSKLVFDIIAHIGKIQRMMTKYADYCGYFKPKQYY